MCTTLRFERENPKVENVTDEVEDYGRKVQPRLCSMDNWRRGVGHWAGEPAPELQHPLPSPVIAGRAIVSQGQTPNPPSLQATPGRATRYEYNCTPKIRVPYRVTGTVFQLLDLV